MELGFIQMAAPASQPGPLVDASSSSDPAADAAAFDAALSANLGQGEVGADQSAAVRGRAGQPAWLLASLFAPTVTAFDIATPTATAAVEIAPEGEEVPADLSAEPTSPDELLELPANIAVPVPVIAEIKNPVLPQGLTIAAAPGKAGAAVTGEPTQPNPAAVALPQPRAFAAAPEAASPERQPAAVTRPAAMANAPIQAAAVVEAAPVATAGVPAAPVATAVETTNAPVDQAVASEVSASIETDRRDGPQARATMKADAARPEFADKATQRTETAPQNAAAAAVANAVAAVAEPATPQAAKSATVGSEPAESAAMPRTVVAWHAQSGQDAPMTGQEQQRGQNRQSPEFARFAAALAQVTSAEDGGRAVAPVVTPAASSAAPAPAAPAAAATAVATPPSMSETPEAENVGRLVQAMRVISRPGAWEATVRLKPEHFGDVSIAVKVERNTVSAVVNAEQAGVCEWLESQEQTVRSGMAEHGLQLERFVVQRDGQRRDAEAHDQQEPRRQGRRRQATPTERFEIVV